MAKMKDDSFAGIAAYCAADRRDRRDGIAVDTVDYVARGDVDLVGGAAILDAGDDEVDGHPWRRSLGFIGQSRKLVAAMGVRRRHQMHRERHDRAERQQHRAGGRYGAGCHSRHTPYAGGAAGGAAALLSRERFPICFASFDMSSS